MQDFCSLKSPSHGNVLKIESVGSMNLIATVQEAKQRWEEERMVLSLVVNSPGEKIIEELFMIRSNRMKLRKGE